MRFEKVSFDEYYKAAYKAVHESGGVAADIQLNSPEFSKTVKAEYDDIRLPKRATKGSAGYDFFAPAEFWLKPGETAKIATGIRVKLDEDKFLAIYPRSGLGFKYRMRLNNTVAIIDSDYYCSDNEGHIFIKITNECTPNGEDDTIHIEKGAAFAQGIIQQFFLTDDDAADGVRNGGMGSTD